MMSVTNSPLDENYVVVPAYNGADLLEACIASILESRGDWQVVVVDNNSTDETHVRWSQSKSVHYIKNSENQGFGRACNIGAEWALQQGAKTITFLNQDATVSPETLLELAGTLSKHPKCAIACPINFEEEGLISGQFSRWLTSGNERIMGDALRNELKEDYTVGFLNAACWMFSKTSLEHMGGFDPLFFMYQEDKEMAARVAYFELEIRVNPQASILHQRSLRAQRSNLGDRIRWSSVAPYANLIGGTRNYKRSLWRNLPGTLLNWLKAIFAYILAVNIVGVTGHLLALFQFSRMARLNYVHFHKIKNRENGLFL